MSFLSMKASKAVHVTLYKEGKARTTVGRWLLQYIGMHQKKLVDYGIGLISVATTESELQGTNTFRKKANKDRYDKQSIPSSQVTTTQSCIREELRGFSIATVQIVPSLSLDWTVYLVRWKAWLSSCTLRLLLSYCLVTGRCSSSV
jgi:hypothetical protein